MRLSLTEDQTLLAKTATSFVAEKSPLSRVRKLRDSADPLGYSKELWAEMAGLGWTGIPFAEAHGGAGLGMAEVVLITEALGRCLAPEPLLSCVMMAGQALELGGTDRQRSEMLRPLIEGEKVLALAHHERGSRYDLHHVRTRATRSPAGAYQVAGTKTQVIGGYGADAFVVVARTSGNPEDASGLTMLLLPADAKGVKVVRQSLVDGRNAAILELDAVNVPESAVVGGIDRGAELLEDVIDRATVALCGEMLGGMTEAFGRTLAYLKERVQFGVVIGTFQALKHRAARMFIEVELARSSVTAAARAIDERSEQRRALVSTAKARCSDAYVHIANEAIQMFGGIGMTDEHDIGFFIKRARVAEMTFGDAAHHRDRFARLMGF
jgi:alkylation response protein AidB-like acyl-CoA dehydrogenase